MCDTRPFDRRWWKEADCHAQLVRSDSALAPPTARRKGDQMATAQINLDGRELRINLGDMTDQEAHQTFLHLGRFLQKFSDRRLACLGNAIVHKLTGEDQSSACIFCAIDRREGRTPCGQSFTGDGAKKDAPVPASGRRQSTR